MHDTKTHVSIADKASRGFEPRLLDSESRVLTVTPRGLLVVYSVQIEFSIIHHHHDVYPLMYVQSNVVIV